jgi:hypothetical protein
MENMLLKREMVVVGNYNIGYTAYLQKSNYYVTMTYVFINRRFLL